MKKWLIPVLSVLIILGGIGVYFPIKKKIMLSSGKNLFLVNQDKGIYTFSNLIDIEEVSQYKIKGYASDLPKSAQGMAEVTEGLTYYNPQPTRTTAIAIPQPSVEQSQAWQDALKLLTLEQINLCKGIAKTDLANYCLVRHLVFQILTTDQDVEICKAALTTSFIDECVKDVNNQAISKVADKNNNGLIDIFES